MNILKGFQYRFTRTLAMPLIISLACAQERSNPPAIVIRYCSGCHGVDGNSQLPYIPRLAGLSTAYLDRKLTTFRAAASAPVDEAFERLVHIGNVSKNAGFSVAATVHMVGITHAVSDTDLKPAVEWYAAQQPAPGKSRRGKAVEQGKSLYFNGVQSQRLSACQTCHGREAQGSDAAPRLAGQNAAYVVGQLALFRAGDPHNSPMTEVARCLERDQARAVAVYLESR